MRVGITTVQSPFIRGGAEIHTANLARAVREAGYEVEVITMPFRFHPLREVRRSMDMWEAENFDDMNGYGMEVVIPLKFPTWYLQHHNKVPWLIHQYRTVYDLWNTPHSANWPNTPDGEELRCEVVRRDNAYLGACRKIYGNSKVVCARLLEFNGIPSTPLYHPPLNAEKFYNASPEPFIFVPSRFEVLKRQDLVIKAMQYVRTPVIALLAGEGGQRTQMQRLVEELDVGQQVRIFGPVFGDELLAYYARCLAVFFGPRDEDLGYITLEAMLSGKPVITCTDSGGPLEFVVDKETGYIVEPTPESIAEAFDKLYLDRTAAAEMGRAGRERYRDLNISWDHVLQELLS